MQKFSEMAVDSAQDHTAWSQSRKTQITRRNLYKNRKYFNPLLSGQGRLDLWSTVPLKRIRKSHMTPRSLILCGALEKSEYLDDTKNETILTHWSVAHGRFE